MNKNTLYSISESGREPLGNFTSLKEARAALREMVQDSLKAARRRYGKAWLHKGDDAYEITLGSDRRSALWASFGLVGGAL
jgi:hypothetical protein